MGKLTSWLTKEEPIRPIPVFDKTIIFLHKISYLLLYLILRFLLRILLGRKRRNKIFGKTGIHFNYEYDTIPSLSIIKFYPLVQHLTSENKNPFLLKIKISKDHYRAYCPINKDDLINMTIREDGNNRLFSPQRERYRRRHWCTHRSLYNNKFETNWFPWEGSSN